MLASDALAAERGGTIGGTTVLALVRGGLLDSLRDAGLLPPQTLSQATPPIDTAFYWIDTGTNPSTLKRHNGTAWVAATFADVYTSPREMQSQAFLNPGVFNWAVPAGVTTVFAHVIGGGAGGSGGSASSGTHSHTFIGGGGGGSGGEAWGVFDVSGETSIAVTVGFGGIGGLYSATGTSSGGSGGSSSFAAFITGFGGGGGIELLGGTGGVGAGGDMQRKGNEGHIAITRGFVNQWYGGSGGGANRAPQGNHANGQDAIHAGGGGGGSPMQTTTNAAVRGGDGSDGAVYIRWVA